MGGKERRKEVVKNGTDQSFYFNQFNCPTWSYPLSFPRASRRGARNDSVNISYIRSSKYGGDLTAERVRMKIFRRVNRRGGGGRGERRR